MKRKILSIIGCIMALIMCMSFTACGNTAEAKAESFVSLDVNPSIELTLDENDKVISARGTNEDGQVLLVDVNLKGLTVEKAVEKITDLAVEFGYLDEENKVVGTSVSAKDEAAIQELLQKVNAKVVATAEAAGETVTTDGAGAWSLLRKFEAFKTEHPELATYLNDMSISEFKLAVSASETGEISLEAAVQLDDAKLIDIIHDARKNVEAYATDAYLKAKASAEATYNDTIGAELDKLYENLDVDIITQGLMAANNLIYKALNEAARVFDKYADQLIYLEDIGSYDITTQANAMVLALNSAGVEITLDELKNNDGKVTLDSVYAFLDKYYKNHKDDAGIETIMSGIESTLKNIEDAAQSLVNTATSTVDTILSTMLGSIGEHLPDGIVVNDGIDQAEARIIADHLREKADEIAAQIEELLGDDVVKQIKNKKAQIERDFAADKARMESEIKTHRDSAKNALNQIKENLRTQHSAPGAAE